MGTGFSRPRLDVLRIEGDHLVETLQGLTRSAMLQENFRLRGPWTDEVPLQGNRPIVVLDRSAPSAFLFEEFPLPEDDHRVLRVLAEGLREEGFRRLRVAEAEEGIAEAEDRAGLRGVHIEDRLEQDYGFVRVAVPTEL